MSTFHPFRRTSEFSSFYPAFVEQANPEPKSEVKKACSPEFEDAWIPPAEPMQQNTTKYPGKLPLSETQEIFFFGGF